MGLVGVDSPLIKGKQPGGGCMSLTAGLEMKGSAGHIDLLSRDFSHNEYH